MDRGCSGRRVGVRLRLLALATRLAGQRQSARRGGLHERRGRARLGANYRWRRLRGQDRGRGTCRDLIIVYSGPAVTCSAWRCLLGERRPRRLVTLGSAYLTTLHHRRQRGVSCCSPRLAGREVERAYQGGNWWVRRRWSWVSGCDLRSRSTSSERDNRRCLCGSWLDRCAMPACRSHTRA
ncbi:hypothetical protein Ae706Ps2_6725c [Pseudonocardia sp. Ae706_Ps2]|nr:hypothetical protein Ae706Ps2_6725c [Pseudonocardia sp. Ae706_Ps2]